MTIDMNGGYLNNSPVHQCHCVGPQNGEPFCPCRMREVKIVDGRYVKDLGPVKQQDTGISDEIDRLEKGLVEAYKLLMMADPSDEEIPASIKTVWSKRSTRWKEKFQEVIIKHLETNHDL